MFGVLLATNMLFPFPQKDLTRSPKKELAYGSAWKTAVMSVTLGFPEGAEENTSRGAYFDAWNHRWLDYLGGWFAGD